MGMDSILVNSLFQMILIYTMEVVFYYVVYVKVTKFQPCTD